MLDHLQHKRNVARERVVIESQDLAALAFEKSVPRGVVALAIGRECTIKFYDEFFLNAYKIGDEWVYQKLVLEFVATQLTVANVRPKEIFHRDGLMTHFFGARAVERLRLSLLFLRVRYQAERPPLPALSPASRGRGFFMSLTCLYPAGFSSKQ
jgi:hypothetical protein